MKLSILLCSFLVTFFGTVQANGFSSIEDAFNAFAKLKKYEGILQDNFERKIDEKNSLVELVKGNTTVQFARYEGKGNEYIYVFNYFSDSSFNQPGIALGCYKYIDNQWVEVTDMVMPMLTFNDFYGTQTAPPKSYKNTVQFRFVLHKSKVMHIVIEPKMNHEDPKFDRIFDQRKYAAVQTRWNKNEERFEIAKWLK